MLSRRVTFTATLATAERSAGDDDDDDDNDDDDDDHNDECSVSLEVPGTVQNPP